MERQVRMWGIPSLPAAARLDLAAGRGVRGWLRSAGPQAHRTHGQVRGVRADADAASHRCRDSRIYGCREASTPRGRDCWVSFKEVSIFVWQWLPSLRGDC